MSELEKQVVTPEKTIDLEKVLAAKNVKVPGFVLRFMKRLLHVDAINNGIYNQRQHFGVDFAREVLAHEVHVDVVVEGEENIPSEGYPIVAGNHPLGGPDGMALISAVGRKRPDVKFPVNDFLMHLINLKDTFVPIDKVHRNTSNVAGLEEAFAGKNTLLYFPAGLCSRKQHGVIKDTEWKPTFVKKAVQHHRDIVPVFVDAQNRRRFYAIANLRKKLGIKFNFEMALLPAEMFAQEGKTCRIVVGQPIPWQTFDSRHTAREWAAMLREYVYELKENPQAKFRC
ncbi:MAG: glycerol acyltransferase [Bacteroidales bacterium]|nr:glycerol acyltransferase [Bacteroidales bacterium]